MTPDFDKSDVYEKEIEPLCGQMLRVCNENRIPFFMAFGDKLTNGKFRAGDGLECTTLLPEVLEIKHNDPCFAGFAKIVNGAQALYPEEMPQEMDAEEDAPWDEEDEKKFGKGPVSI